MKRILMPVADGFEEIEALGTADILRRCGVYVELCSATRHRRVVSSRQITVLCDSTLEEIRTEPDGWDGIVLPGGQPNADTLRENQTVLSLVRAFREADKLCCAICAAPIVLERAGLLQGKTVTAYPGCLEDETACRYTGAPVSAEGNLITGNGPSAACDFAFAIAESLGLSEQAASVRRAMLFS